MPPAEYTLEEWLRGVPPPLQPQPPVPPGYIYGVGVGVNDKIIPYLIKNGAMTPPDVYKVLEAHEADVPFQEAARLRNELYKKAKAQQKAALLQSIEEARQASEEAERQEREREIRRQEIGRVAAHSDGLAIHMAILLDPAPQSFALFLTSRPGWARKSRPLTPEERDLCGLKNPKPTWLAPVVRPRSEFSLTGRQFSDWRVVELLEEFTRDDAS